MKLMRLKKLVKAPQLIVVYAITILYTVTFSLAAVIKPSTGSAAGVQKSIHQVAKIEKTNGRKLLTVSHTSEGSSGQSRKKLGG